MNFTREPIIETIVTPKDGYKLVVRNSKGGGVEEYLVDSVEVVSFGHSFFFRSLERPKCFLVPVSDYEIVEVKETRVALKNVSHERSIKIGGGRDAPIRTQREPAPEKAPEPAVAEEGALEGDAQTVPQEQRQKRDRHRRRRRRGGGGSDEREWRGNGHPQEQQQGKSSETGSQAETAEGGDANDETQVSSSTFSTLFPPPTTLISETIGRYKDFAISEGTLPPKQVEAAPKEETPTEKKRKNSEPDEDFTGGDSNLSRVSINSFETQPFQTSFSPLSDDTYLS